jgi:hypothetical protein
LGRETDLWLVNPAENVRYLERKQAEKDRGKRKKKESAKISHHKLSRARGGEGGARGLKLRFNL